MRGENDKVLDQGEEEREREKQLRCGGTRWRNQKNKQTRLYNTLNSTNKCYFQYYDDDDVYTHMQVMMNDNTKFRDQDIMIIT